MNDFTSGGGMPQETEIEVAARGAGSSTPWQDHNPLRDHLLNGKDRRTSALSYLTIVEDRCPQNHRCPAVAVCPVGALTQNGLHAPTVDRSKCTHCGKCAKQCPTGALRMAK